MIDKVMMGIIIVSERNNGFFFKIINILSMLFFLEIFVESKFYFLFLI